MPLHDWSKLPEWDGVHQLWIVELYRDIKSKLPPGYRAGMATVPSLTVGFPATHPDVSVQRNGPNPAPLLPADISPDDLSAFDTEVTISTLDSSKAIEVFHDRDLVAVLELISPRNKYRLSTRTGTVDKIVGYLSLGIHVMYVDVHARPYEFSLADAIAKSLDYPQIPCPSPQAMAYRINWPLQEGDRTLAVRRAPLAIGQPLPSIGLPLSQTLIVPVDLEATYTRATGEYLSWLPSINGADHAE